MVSAWASWNATTVPAPDAPDGIAPELPDSAEPANLDAVQNDWRSALDDLLSRWTDYEATQKLTILDAVEAHVASGDPISLLGINASSSEAAAALEAAMMTLGLSAANQVVHEALAQGLADSDIHAIGPERVRTASNAQVYAGMLVTYLVGSAIGETMRTWSPGRRATDVRIDVGEHLNTLTDAYPKLVIGGALTQAQHDGRLRTMTGGPEAAIYADERLDVNTCKPCRDINRKWLGNSTDRAMIEKTYPVAGYIGCLGRWRCRGQVVAVWRGGSDWKKWIELPPQRT